MSNANWVVVGASPSAPDHFGAAVGRWLHPTTMTTNGGILLFNGEAPTYYWLHDKFAKDTYRAHSFETQKRGTQLVTLRTIDGKTPDQRGLGHFDILVDSTIEGGALMNGKGQFFRGAYTNSGYSGLFCCQFAINNGAKKIAMVGMEGYRSNVEEQEPDTFCEPGQPGSTLGAFNTEQMLGPVTQDMVTQCPDIAFTFYGTPVYQLEGPNLEVVT